MWYYKAGAFATFLDLISPSRLPVGAVALPSVTNKKSFDEYKIIFLSSEKVSTLPDSEKNYTLDEVIHDSG